jgi:predicted AAA+ superfamily ATPase
VYIQRNQLVIAQRYLKNFPVLSLLGPRQAGKTTLAKQLAADWKYFDLERASDYNLITNNPQAFFENYPQQIIIDEAQEFPQLLKIMRGVIDGNREQKGRFIITGSSSPLLSAQLSDSLAGRVGILNIRPLKANEYYSKPLSKFYNIFNKLPTMASLDIGEQAISNQEMRHCWLYGGYPEPLLNSNPDFYADWMNNYFNTYINRDIAKLFPRLDNRAYQRFISILASLSGTIINKSDLARALEISEGSVREYLQIAEQTYIWRNIHHDDHSMVKSIVKRPKGYICDSGLAHFLQRLENMDKLLLSPHQGHSFESFIIEEIIRGLEASDNFNFDYSYYRTIKGAELDLIIECAAGIIPIEIKMASSVSKTQLQAMNKYLDDNKLNFGLVINQSEHVFWLSNRILQVPIGFL